MDADRAMLRDVSRERFEELVDARTESEFVDYKVEYDLGKTKSDELKMFAKDVASFADKGGWIVIGVDDSGDICGVPREVRRQFDEATLSARLEKYLGAEIELLVASHRAKSHRGEKVSCLLVQVMPHRDGACVLRQDLQLTSGRTIARQGDVLTRHRTKSERVNQSDMSRILNKRTQITLDSERAARNARAAAYSSNACAEPPSDDCLFMQLGWAASRTPIDFTRRAFYVSGREHSELESTLWSALESKRLRRNGHTFAHHVADGPDELRRYGRITHASERDAFVDVRIHADGWLSIAAWEDVSEWTLTELFGWWVHGAFEVAHLLARQLGLAGDLYTCARFRSRSHFSRRIRSEVVSWRLSPGGWDIDNERLFARSQVSKLIDTSGRGQSATWTRGLPEDFDSLVEHSRLSVARRLRQQGAPN